METIKDKMSHKQEQELKLKIQSEKQRMEREQEIRIPYHRPKQYSLKEFLARKTINKPPTGKIQQGESTILKLKRLNNPEELEKFAQKMKEREEEALEFFRSESESDDVGAGDNKENVQSDDKKSENAKIDDQNPETGSSSEITGSDSKELETTEEMHSVLAPEVSQEETEMEVDRSSEISKEPKVSPMEVDSEDIKDDPTAEKPSNPDDPQPNSTNADPLLDNLREKYKNLPEVNMKPKFKSLKTLDELSKSTDFVIDLETGGIVPKKLSGPEMLFQRFLKTVQKPKPKESVCMNILSIENGSLENQKVEVKLEKEVELDHNRPGHSHEKLKEQLLNKIKMQRNEEYKKRAKQEEEKLKELEPEDKEKKGNQEENEKPEEDEDDYVEEECEDEEEEVDDEAYEKFDKLEKKKKKKAGGAFLDEEVSFICNKIKIINFLVNWISQSARYQPEISFWGHIRGVTGNK